jgi:hypothetical protein
MTRRAPTLPGIKDLIGLGNFFDIGFGAGVLAYAANDAQGNDARFVIDNAQGVARRRLQLALARPSNRSAPPLRRQWSEAQLRNTADWIAYWSKLHGIPIQRGRVGNGQVIKPGVVMHSELGAIGGGHHDPGPAYPIEQVLEYAIHASPDARKQKVWKAHLANCPCPVEVVARHPRPDASEPSRAERPLRADDPAVERAAQDDPQAQAPDRPIGGTSALKKMVGNSGHGRYGLGDRPDPGRAAERHARRSPRSRSCRRRSSAG